MSRRHEPTDAQWALIQPHLPPAGRGRAWADHRRVVGGVFFWAATGVQWRDLPERFGPWQTVYERFRRWRDDGTWAKLLRALQGTADELGLIDWSVFGVDSTVARASRAAGGGKTTPPGEPADHALGRGRGGFGTKLHLVSCGNGLPVGVALTPAQAGETAGMDAALASVSVPRPGRGRPRRRPAAIAGDKGYDHPSVRRRLARRGVKVVIAHRRPHPRHRPSRGRRSGSTGCCTAGGTPSSGASGG